VELGATTRGWRLAGVGLGAASSGDLGWGFYRREREDGGLGMSCCVRRNQGVQNQGRGCLAVTGESHRGASSARGGKMPPRGGFVRGKSGFFRPAGDLQGAGGPT
jgi:hypothetical protein